MPVSTTSSYLETQSSDDYIMTDKPIQERIDKEMTTELTGLSNSRKVSPSRNGGTRRLRADERERQFRQEAEKLFAERGFEAGTTELAERLGIAQPLLYRYFRNKQDLMRKVYSQAHASEDYWTAWENIIDDSSRSVRDRLIDFYVSYSEVTWSYNFTRMALWANLSRPELNQVYYAGVRARVFPRIVREMRIHFGITKKAARPTKLEFELVHTLHGMIYYLAIRRWVHVQPFRDNVRSLIELKVDLFLHGAAAILAMKSPPKNLSGSTPPHTMSPRTFQPDLEAE